MPSEREIRERLVQEVSTLSGIPVDRIDVREPFASYSIASIEAVQMVGTLETLLGLTLDETLLWDHTTIEALARHLAGAVKAK